MQLTCAPVSKRDENARSFTFILKVVPFVVPLFPLYCHLPLHGCSSLLVRPTNFPISQYFHSCLASMQLFPSGLNDIIFWKFIYLIAASSLLFELLTFKLHCKVKLLEEVATKFSGYIAVRLLSQGDLGVFLPLCPLFGLSVFLRSVLLVFVLLLQLLLKLARLDG